MLDWEVGVDYPEWMKPAGLSILSKGYLIADETPNHMYRRVAVSAAESLGKPELADKFFDIMWKGWLCPASPVLTNMGTKRGMPISCYGLSVPDSIDGIYQSCHELAVLTKGGGGVGMCLTNIRGRGVPIRNNGASEGVVPWAKVYDSAIVATSQGQIRRGAASVNLDVDHIDIEEFLRIRRPSGDVNRQCLNLHQCVLISDKFMTEMLAGDKLKRELWLEILKTRLETGEPYIMFKDTVNRDNPPAYKQNHLKVEMTNICTEITLHTDELHSFICCLASLNLAKWNEWKDTDVVETTVQFLNGVLNEFIDRADGINGYERAVRSAVKGRAIGIGVLGWHSLLQSEMTSMDSLRAKLLNRSIFSRIRTKAEIASKQLAVEFGEPEWCKGTGMYNSHLIAVAPTRSNSTIAGVKSPSIEAWIANAFSDKTAKGVFTIKNEHLEKVLEKHGKNTHDVWMSIVANQGSVQHLEFLEENELDVFKTAYEIDQKVFIELAGDRQEYIDQAQSLNLFFSSGVDPRYFHQVHVEAWKAGVKTLYYCRSSSSIKADMASRSHEDGCKSCEG